MRRPLRDLLRDMAIYGAGDILLRAAALLTLPIYTRIFSPEQFGIFNVVQTVIGLAMALLLLGGDGTFARFFLAARDTNERQVIASTWLVFLASWSCLIIAISLPFSGIFSQIAFATPAYAMLFSLALLSVPLSLLNSMCNQALRNMFRPRDFSLLNLAGSSLSIGFSLIAVIGLQLGLLGWLGGMLLAAGCMLPLRLWVIRDLLRPVFSFSHLKAMLGFGLPLVPYTIASWIFAFSDRFVLTQLSTLEQVGLYAIATGVIGLLSFASGSVAQAWMPHATRMFEQRDPAAPALFGQVLTYLLVAFGSIGVVLTTFAHEGLLLFTTAAYLPAVVAVGPLTLAVTAHVSMQVTGAPLNLLKRTHYYAILAWPAALLNVGLNLWLIPHWGMLAAAWTTAAAYGFLTLAYLMVAQRLWPIAYEIRRSLSAIGLLVVFTVGAPLLPDLDLGLRIGVKLGYCLLFAILLIAAGVIDTREWQALRRLLPNR
ncbi:MAG TPA: oligosaccharide flippase family protein [Roseiflexaceae bacterium]|nr:oligosaccharide flippase family protein [Roseiflexaceae bacterium]